MSYVFQVGDDDIRIAVQVPGKYNPDILEDGKRRTVDLYKEVLAARAAYVETYSEKDEPSA